MLAKEIKESLEKMEFGELRRLIDHCLNNNEIIDKKNLSFVTQNTDKLLEYVDILEAKKKPLYSPSQFILANSTKLQSLSELKKESEQLIKAKENMILAKEKEYEQITATLKQSLFAIENQQNEIKEELDACQEKLNKMMSESPVYKRLLYWSAKMQGSNLGEDTLNAERNLTVKIDNLKTILIFFEKKSKSLKHFTKDEKTRISSSINALNLLVKAQKARNFKEEIESQKAYAERELNIKLNKYKSSFNSILKSYENSISARIIRRLRSDTTNFNSYILTAQKLNWKLLPTGEMTFNQLREYIEEISRYSENEFDAEKIEKIFSLNADKIYCGNDDFDGYLVFYFEKIKIAVLDCPRKGNAIYIFGEDWKKLSRLSKFELLNYHTEKTERIIHRGDWFERLETLLKTRRRKSHYE